VLDALVPEGSSANEMIAQAQEHFKQAGAVCRSWVLAPGAQESQTAPVAEALLSRGFAANSFDILHLNHQPTSPIREVAALTIIPARASYKHVHQLAEEWAVHNQAP